MMTEHPEDEGTIEVLLSKIANRTLPQVLAIKKKLDLGEKLNDYDIDVLLDIYEKNRRNREIFHRHKEYVQFETELMALYAKVMEEGLHNEDADNTKNKK